MLLRELLAFENGRRSGLFFFSSRRRHTRWPRDWSSDVCSSDVGGPADGGRQDPGGAGFQAAGELPCGLSWVLTRPSLGRVTWWRSGSTRMVPVVNRQASRARPFLLNLGNPARPPWRRPALP